METAYLGASRVLLDGMLLTTVATCLATIVGSAALVYKALHLERRS